MRGFWRITSAKERVQAWVGSQAPVCYRPRLNIKWCEQVGTICAEEWGWRCVGRDTWRRPGVALVLEGEVALILDISNCRNLAAYGLKRCDITEFVPGTSVQRCVWLRSLKPDCACPFSVRTHSKQWINLRQIRRQPNVWVYGFEWCSADFLFTAAISHSRLRYLLIMMAVHGGRHYKLLWCHDCTPITLRGEIKPSAK